VLKRYFRPGREDFRKAIENAMPGMLVSSPARLLAGNVEYAEASGPSQALDTALAALDGMTAANWSKRRGEWGRVFEVGEWMGYGYA